MADAVMSKPPSREMSLALQALECCSLTELGAIELYHFRRIKRQVAERTVAKCATSSAKAGESLAEVLWTAELEAEAVAQGADVPFVVEAGTAGEQVTEPIEVSAEPGQWPESHTGPVS